MGTRSGGSTTKTKHHRHTRKLTTLVHRTLQRGAFGPCGICLPDSNRQITLHLPSSTDRNANESSTNTSPPVLVDTDMGYKITTTTPTTNNNNNATLTQTTTTTTTPFFFDRRHHCLCPHDDPRFFHATLCHHGLLCWFGLFFDVCHHRPLNFSPVFVFF